MSVTLSLEEWIEIACISRWHVVPKSRALRYVLGSYLILRERIKTGER